MSGDHVTRTIAIAAPPPRVWAVLTTPRLMRAWISDAQVDVETTWAIGGPFVMRGDLHGVDFETKGALLALEENVHLAYTTLPNISALPDVAASYSTVDISLRATSGGTELTVVQSNIKGAAALPHVSFYWTGTLLVIKRIAEATLDADGDR